MLVFPSKFGGIPGLTVGGVGEEQLYTPVPTKRIRLSPSEATIFDMPWIRIDGKRGPKQYQSTLEESVDADPLVTCTASPGDENPTRPARPSPSLLPKRR